jgi:hypothetical protein
MPSSLSSGFKSVLDQFTPDILGAFWLTESELSREISCFDEFNYLFDGLLSQYLYGQSLEKGTLPKANIFFTQNFNKKIFLSHIKCDGDISGALDEQMAIVKLATEERKKILVLNNTSKDWVAGLQKRYSQFEFITLELR